MKISEVLQAVQEFREYAEAGTGGCWLLVSGSHGPVPVFAPARENWRKQGHIFSALQVITVGWEEAHAPLRWPVKPDRETIMEALELSEKNYRKIQAAAHGLQPYNARLRADLLAACGLEEP